MQSKQQLDYGGAVPASANMQNAAFILYKHQENPN